MQLPLPISPTAALAQIIDPALALLPVALTSDPARLQLLVHGLQETEFASRTQMNNGPAHGLWQCERGGAVAGVLGNATTERMARSLCALRGVPATSYGVYTSLPGDDILAAGIARLALYADPLPLPAVGDAAGAWECYLRTWRPGAYARGTAQQRADIEARFGAHYAQALKTLTAVAVH